MLDEAQAGIKVVHRNISKLRYADGNTLMAESKEELKSLLMKVKEESEKVDIKLNIQKSKIMASVPITSWQIDGETMKTVTDFIIIIGSKNHCRWWLQLWNWKTLVPWKKIYDQARLSRNIAFPTKVHLVKALVFPVVIYECESLTIKKAEHQSIVALELWCWRKLLRVHWIARISNQSILKEISPEYSLEELMLKLKLQFFGNLMWRTDTFEKTLMLGMIEGRRRIGNKGWDGWMASPTQ